MASLYNDRIAFIHVPKTAGSWVAEALRETVPGLQGPSDVEGDRYWDDVKGEHRYWDEMPTDRFSFAFVRHPVTWYRSYFMFVKAKGVPAAEGDLLWAAAHEAPDFRDFVERVTCDHPGVLSMIYGLYLGEPGDVDFVGRYEALRENLLRALVLSGEAETWGEAFQMRRALILTLRTVNESQGEKPAITPDITRLIHASEQEAMERFGYAPALVS